MSIKNILRVFKILINLIEMHSRKFIKTQKIYI